jgi:hypothetical protein
MCTHLFFSNPHVYTTCFRMAHVFFFWNWMAHVWSTHQRCWPNFVLSHSLFSHWANHSLCYRAQSIKWPPISLKKNQVASQAQEECRSSLRRVLEARCVAAAGSSEARSDGGFGIIPERRSTRKIEEVSPAAMLSGTDQTFHPALEYFQPRRALLPVVWCFWHFILTKPINRKASKPALVPTSNNEESPFCFPHLCQDE